MIRGISRLAGAGLVLLAMASAAQAQGPNMQVVPKIGVFTPIGTFTENTELELGLAVGLAGEFTLPALPFDVRLNLEHATTTDIVERGVAETVLGDVSVTSVVGALVLRPLPPTAAFHPYFMGGGGLKLYRLRSEAGFTGDLAGVAETTRRGAFYVGGGVDARVGPITLLLEVADYISTFPLAGGDTRLQNHLYGMLGFRVAMF
jgi:hypothetical protein